MSPTRTIPSGALARRERDAARHRGQQRVPAGVVGVLAEDLDAAWCETAPLRRAFEDRLRPLFELAEQLRARRGVGGCHAQRFEMRRDRIHSRTSTPVSRSLTRATSLRRDRSSTAPRASKGAEPDAALDSQSDRFGQLILAAFRQRHIAAGIEDAVIESPDVHADQGSRPGCVVIFTARLLDNPRQVAITIDFNRRESRHPIRRKAAVVDEGVPRIRRQAGAIELDERAQHGSGVEVVRVEHQERVGAQRRVARSARRERCRPRSAAPRIRSANVMGGRRLRSSRGSPRDPARRRSTHSCTRHPRARSTRNRERAAPRPRQSASCPWHPPLPLSPGFPTAPRPRRPVSSGCRGRGQAGLPSWINATVLRLRQG